MTFRLTAALAVTALVAVAAPASASAAAASPGKQATKILRDCTDDGRLSKRYPVRALRRAKRMIPKDVRTYTNCERLINRAIARGGKPPKGGRRGNGPRAVVKDCAADGSVDRRFPVRTLRQALRQLPADAARRSDCKAAIEREIRRRA